MDDVVRLLLRFVLVPLGYFAAALAGTAVMLIASWHSLGFAGPTDPDETALAVLGFAIGGPLLLVVVLVVMLLPASIGILISEAFAIRSWMFHVLNGVASAWVGWLTLAPVTDSVPLREPVDVIAAGIAGGLAYWGVAGFSAGFWKPVFKHGSVGTAVTPAGR